VFLRNLSDEQWGTVETDLKLTGLLELGHITLALKRTAGRQEDVLMATIDVLSPRRKPSNSVIMDNLFPLSRDIGNWNRCFRSYVKGNILRIDTQLEHVSKAS
jgi:hypothetical protein